jgi:YaiO family outer membrane protein
MDENVTMRLSEFPYSIAAVWVLFLSCSPARAEEDLLTHARTLATSQPTSQHRQEALDLLAARLSEHPTDVDARLLYGLILSWEGRWDGARQALQQVLAQTPGYADAVIALANVEIWSGHPDAADVVTSKYLEQKPDNIGVLLARARAMRALKLRPEELQVLNSVFVLEPGNKDAADMRRAMREDSSAWDFSSSYDAILFSDHSSAWNEEVVTVRRGVNAGSLIFRESRAYRWGYTSNLLEVDWYPHIRPGTYAYLNFGYSPEGILYPTFRAGAELFQNFGRGYEASAGVRRLMFGSTNVSVYTGSMGRYYKNWYASARTFIVPGDPRPSISGQLLVRRYFGDGERYVGFRYGRGAAPFEIRNLNDIGVLDSSSYGAETYWRYGNHFLLSASGGTAKQDRINRVLLQQYYFSLGATLRL